MNNAPEEKPKLRKEIIRQMGGYVTTAVSLVVALAWNDAIKDLITYLFPLSTNTIFAKFIYAMVLTAAVIMAMRAASRFIGR